MAEKDVDSRLIELGEQVRKVRESKGMTQTELAYKVDKEQPSLNRVEKGRINPSYKYLLDLAEGLGVHISELIPEKK
ncbi:helix-turn-helix domain-containing protein [Ekhidna sp.]